MELPFKKHTDVPARCQPIAGDPLAIAVESLVMETWLPMARCFADVLFSYGFAQRVDGWIEVVAMSVSIGNSCSESVRSMNDDDC